MNQGSRTAKSENICSEYVETVRDGARSRRKRVRVSVVKVP